MPAPLVECVPNFSEGRDAATLDALRAAITSVLGVRLLDVQAATELAIPVYLYARAATRPERERLPDIRKGEFEGLRDRIGRDPAADPDFGPKRIHPTAGATAVGARPFLVAFNIYLDTGDVRVAKEIAQQIRTSGGGLPAVQAAGVEVDGRAQGPITRPDGH